MNEREKIQRLKVEFERGDRTDIDLTDPAFNILIAGGQVAQDFQRYVEICDEMSTPPQVPNPLIPGQQIITEMREFDAAINPESNPLIPGTVAARSQEAREGLDLTDPAVNELIPRLFQKTVTKGVSME